MRPQTRDRLVLPILLPIGILVAIGLVLWGFSRLLLGIHGSPATAVAVIVAASILAIAAIAAARPQVRGSTVGAVVGATAGVAMLAGGIALAVVGGEEAGGPGNGGGNVVALVAQNIAFDPTMLTVPGGQPFTIAFDNRDTVQHNVAIFDNAEHSGSALFEGDIVTGPIQVDYQVDPLDAGTYYFLCQIHPQMTGQIEAAEGGGGGGGGGGGPGGVTVAASNLAFDTDTIELPPDAPTTITFDNQDAGVPHNIAIYTDDTLSEVLFQGDIITGPDTITYEIPPLPAGEYYFHCDVHPNMNGTVIVGGGGPTGGGTGSTGATGATGTGSTGATGATGTTG
jgi:plastocyanin